MLQTKTQYIWGILRLALGWIFFWAFIDKLFGLGFATQAGKSWLAGGSPTFGFLKFATKGPFASFYQSLAGNPVVDWLFMLGLLFIGVSLLLGIFVKLASFFAIILLLLMFTAGFLPPKHNPILDEHIIYSLVMLGFMFSKAGNYLGLGKWWSQTKIVQKYNIFE